MATSDATLAPETSVLICIAFLGLLRGKYGDRGVSSCENGYIGSLSKGPIPGSLEISALCLSHNLLEGSIPQHLLDGRVPGEKWVAARTSESMF
eukprot:1897348-Amphidinium_carterae.4